MVNRLKRYWNPRSLTWWTSITALISGIMQIYGFEIPGVTEVARPVINAVHEGASPGALVVAGLGGLGIGGKLDALKEEMVGDTTLRPEFEEIDEEMAG